MDFNKIYKAVLDNMSEPVYVRGRNRAIMYMNPAAELLTGQTLSQVLDKSCEEVFGGDAGLCSTACPIDKAIKDNVCLANDLLKVKTKTGQIKVMKASISPFYDDNQQVYGAIVVFASKKELIYQNEIEQLFTLSPDLLCVIDYEGYFKRANLAWEYNLSYTVEELERMQLVSIVHPHDYQKHQQKLEELLLGGLVADMELRVRCKKDSYKWYHWKGMALPEKNLIYFIGRDISLVKENEQELKRLNIELKNKNDELEEIVYVASHDLRSPLVNIQGFSKELYLSFQDLKEIEDREQIMKLLEEDVDEALYYILNSTAKMDNLLRGLLRVSRLGRATVEIRDLDMNSLMDDVIAEFKIRLKDGDITIVKESLPFCKGDWGQVNQVFANLLDNALKYLKPDASGVIKISGYKKDQHSVYCVEDNGIGIPKEYQGKIFELFHRLADNSTQGEGLGLTIAKKLVGRQGGTIWVESEPKIGSKFYVSLPASPLDKERV